MKHLIFALMILLAAGCNQDNPTRKEFDDLKDRVIRQSDSIADAYADIKDLQDAKARQDTLIDDLQREQYYQLQDMNYVYPIAQWSDSFRLKETGRFRFWRKVGRAGGYAREGFKLVTGR